MILVDIYIPALDKTYDFQVEESVPVEDLVMEITEMVGSETKAKNKLSADKFLLCSPERGVIFQKGFTLESYGIRNGYRLILV